MTTRDEELLRLHSLTAIPRLLSLQALSKSLCIALQDAGLDRESDRKRSPRHTSSQRAHGLPVDRSRHRHRTATLLRDWSPSFGHIPLLSPRLHRAGIWVTRRLSRVCHCLSPPAEQPIDAPPHTARLSVAFSSSDKDAHQQFLTRAHRTKSHLNLPACTTKGKPRTSCQALLERDS